MRVRRVQRWVERQSVIWAGWFVMGLMIGWGVTQMVYEWDEPEIQEVRRGAVRIMKQGAQEAVGDE